MTLTLIKFSPSYNPFSFYFYLKFSNKSMSLFLIGIITFQGEVEINSRSLKLASLEEKDVV